MEIKSLEEALKESLESMSEEEKNLLNIYGMNQLFLMGGD